MWWFVCGAIAGAALLLFAVGCALFGWPDRSSRTRTDWSTVPREAPSVLSEWQSTASLYKDTVMEPGEDSDFPPSAIAAIAASDDAGKRSA